MQYYIYKNFLSISLFILIFCFAFQSEAQNKKFVVVIDAGHGGHDAGAIGTKGREKDINLDVSLKVGAIIERNFDDVKVVFTRKTDIFIPLQERANIVNDNHADLFLCIHTNSAQSTSAYGAETYTLGLAKSKANLAVAMTENSVILLEDDYKTKYKGFDPASVDSYIMFEFMQDKYIDKSVEIASSIQKQFVQFSKRSDRGVRQAGFWVLHRSACPSVLIELGFISNPAEQNYLLSDIGQRELATSIYNAFVDFKKDFDRKNGRITNSKQKYELITKIDSSPETKEDLKKVDNLKSEKNENIQSADSFNKITNTSIEKQTIKQNVINEAFNTQNDNKLVFKIQLFASTKKLPEGNSEFKGLKPIEYFSEGGWYKYTYTSETDLDKAEVIRKQIASKFPKAFIIAFDGDKKLSLKEALKLKK